VTADTNDGLARVTPLDRRTLPDWIFRGALIACALSVLLTLAGIVGFLSWTVHPAWAHEGIRLFTTDNWYPHSGNYGFGGDLIGSAVVGVIALVFALPLSIAVALAINEYVPRRFSRPLTSLVDLLAAVPSIVYGFWGLQFLDRHLRGTTSWLGHHGGFFPPFSLVSGQNTDGSLFEAGLVVAIMIIPLVTSVSREVMSQAPRDACEAALALGGTRWGMITEVILPFSAAGIIGGALLGLGRALGEAIAVTLVMNANDRLSRHILQPGGGTVSSLLVREFRSAPALERSALTVAALTLFALTLAVNIGARMIVARGTRAVTR